MDVRTSMTAYSEYSLTNRNNSNAIVCPIVCDCFIYRQTAGLRVLALQMCTWMIEDKVDSSESLILCVLDNKIN